MIRIVKAGGPGYGENYREFVISSSSDVSDLPTADTPEPDTTEAGSIAYTQDLSKTYMLGPDNVWREV